MLRINFHGRKRFWAKISALRISVRASEVTLALVGVVIGGIGGLMVLAIGGIGQVFHSVLFDIPVTQRLSGTVTLDQTLILIVPCLGGLLLGGLLWLSARVRAWPMVDAIEANALHGGRMSFRDSIMLAVQTSISNGFGASVGLEAGYTQVCAAIGSKIGGFLHLRRVDMRIVVGCGAAAAIAGAFDAPLAGAFYAFELIIGTYTLSALAPVMGAAIASTAVVRALHPDTMPISLDNFISIGNGNYVAFIILGFICGFIGIGLMRGVTLVEAMFRQTKIPVYLRPALGGLVVGLLGLVSPQVLSSGHGALHLDMRAQLSLLTIGMLFCLKALASAVSIGSGFRGGLFFAALFLGALLGKFFYGVSILFFPEAHLDPALVAVIGMSALTVAVVGGPLTMGFLALELTGDYVITGIAMTAAVISSLTVRELFGYSFSTWRLHLRGESIRSAQDVGWIRSLSVDKLMQEEVATVDADLAIADFRGQYPIGSAPYVIATGKGGIYVGLVWVSDAYVTEGKYVAAAKVSDLLRQTDVYLMPAMNIKFALEAFDKNSCEVLAVVKASDNLKLVGILSEGYALRRYAAELDLAHRSLAGNV